MIARTWHARLAAGREADYERFAESQSLPMFRGLPGRLSDSGILAAVGPVELEPASGAAFGPR